MPKIWQYIIKISIARSARVVNPQQLSAASEGGGAGGIAGGRKMTHFGFIGKDGRRPRRVDQNWSIANG